MSQQKKDRRIPSRLTAIKKQGKGIKAAETKPKRLIRELNQVEEKYQNIVEHIGVGIAMINPDMRVLTMNRQLREWFPDVNPSVKPFCYESFNDRPSREICSYCPAIRTLRDGQVHEAITDTPTGERVKNFRIIVTPVTDSEGHVVAAIEVVEDITERKRAAEVLRDSEEHFRAMFEVASIGMAQADLQTGQWLRVNEKMCNITGYTPEEMLAMRIPEITHPEDRERDWSMFQQVVRGERKDYRLEKRYIRKDGQVAWVNVNMTVVRDAAGQPIRTMATIEDITERKQAVEELRISEQRYRSYIELTGQLGWTTNADGELVEDLPAWRAFTGLSEEEIKGAGWTKAIHPDDLESTLEAWNKAVAARSAYEIEHRVRRHDGVYRHWLVRSVPLFKEDGSIREWIGTCIDITDRKRDENSLRASTEELKSKTRTLEEMNAALRVLLKQREEDKNDLEERVLASVKELVMPHLGELKKCLSGQKELTHVQILESNLQGIISPFAQKLSLQFLHLTQKEIQIANLIKEGKTTKEIARFMNLSKFAIDTHRAHLRNKLGLTNKKANLRTYLSSITK
jgi:PAS domain S-box-containing protein